MSEIIPNMKTPIPEFSLDRRRMMADPEMIASPARIVNRPASPSSNGETANSKLNTGGARRIPRITRHIPRNRLKRSANGCISTDYFGQHRDAET
ncbi:MAG: hypothetical protein JKX74_08910 [Flavobacteriales bacterium]|nr:hypothetical protein [Flavobacteriales bacterium]